MRIAIVTGRYPSKHSPYEYAFVHTRVKEYVKQGEEVKVFVPAKKAAKYKFEGVVVCRKPAKEILPALEHWDAVMLHLLHVSHERERDGGIIYDYLLKEEIPTLFFVHGAEVQQVALARRYQISLLHPRSLAVAAYHDLFQIPKTKRILERFFHQHARMRFVAVSHWMLKETTRNLGIDLHPKATVIPNGIDTQRFAFEDRWPWRERLLTIRPLVLKGKYAVDLAIETMRHLPPSLGLDIYGKGPDATKIRKRLHAYHLQQQVRVFEGFALPSELPRLHKNHGIYYAVTRMDAQGVSMCEAMASGLPVVSFNVCGIPEFVEHGQTGLLASPYNVREAAALIQELAEDHNLYLRLAQGGRKFAESIDIARTAAQEIQALKRLL